MQKMKSAKNNYDIKSMTKIGRQYFLVVKNNRAK
jgi:hypothetical protein